MRHTLPLAPQFYVTAPQTCPYLDGRMERKLFTALQGETLMSITHEQLLALGVTGYEARTRAVERPGGVVDIEYEIADVPATRVMVDVP